MQILHLAASHPAPSLPPWLSLILPFCHPSLLRSSLAISHPPFLSPIPPSLLSPCLPPFLPPLPVCPTLLHPSLVPRSLHAVSGVFFQLHVTNFLVLLSTRWPALPRRSPPPSSPSPSSCGSASSGCATSRAWPAGRLPTLGGHRVTGLLTAHRSLLIGTARNRIGCFDVTEEVEEHHQEKDGS